MAKRATDGGRHALTLLVIDDDPHIAAFIASLDSRWVVFAAPDALIGLDILRDRHGSGAPIDLVILDIALPGLRGDDAVAPIRQANPIGPILPFTAQRDDALVADYLAEWGCAPLVLKGAALAILRERILNAAQMTVHWHETATMRYVQQAVARIEADARQTHTPRIALFATTVLDLVALKALIAAAGTAVRVIAATTEHAILQEMVQCYHADCVLATTRDAEAVAAIAAEQQLALAIVAPDVASAWQIVDRLHDPPVAIRWPALLGILICGAATPTELPAVIAQLLRGQSYRDPTLLVDPACSAEYLHQFRDRVRIRCSARDLEMLLLDAQGISSDVLVAQLGSTRDTLYKLRSRLYPATGTTTPAALRTWVRRWLCDHNRCVQHARRVSHTESRV